MIKTKTIIVALLIGVSCFWPIRTEAKDLNVNCQDNSCSPISQKSFFSLDNLAPGNQRQFKLHFVNQSSETESIYFSLSPDSSNENDGFKFTLKDGDLVIYSGYLTKDQSLNLGQLQANNSKDFVLLIEADKDLKDEWQGVKFKFDSNLNMEIGSASTGGNSSLEGSTPTLTPTPTPTLAPVPTTRHKTALAKLNSAGRKFLSNLKLNQVLGAKSNQDILASSTAKGRSSLKWLSRYWRLTAFGFGLSLLLFIIFKLKLWQRGR